MKKIIGLLLVFIALSSFTFAQKISPAKVPTEISKTFRSKFPSATQETWAMKGADAYEVVFFNNKRRQSATFDKSGKWVQTETEIQFSEVPRLVNQAINKQFSGFTVQESYQVETPDKGILYEITVMKGKENYDVQISSKGEVLKKEAGEEQNRD